MPAPYHNIYYFKLYEGRKVGGTRKHRQWGTGTRLPQSVSSRKHTTSFILTFGALWRPKASKRHPSQFGFGKQEERRWEGPRFGHVLSSGLRTMQRWQSRSLVPEGMECHMVPLLSGASPEGDVDHNVCARVFVSPFVHALVRKRVRYAWPSVHTVSKETRQTIHLLVIHVGFLSVC